jgi:hypothetical protein
MLQAHCTRLRTRLSSVAPRLRALAGLPGVYVPQYYEVSYLEDGTVGGAQALIEGIANPVLKRIVGQLPPPPTSFIVPNIEIVHNRVSVEIMLYAGAASAGGRSRGRCGAAWMRSQAAVEAVEVTGLEELAPLSLVLNFGRIAELEPGQ